MRRLLQRLDAYDKAHPVWMHDDIRAHSRGRKGVIVAALVCVLAMMAGCSGVTQALDTPADGFDRIVSANGNGYDGDDMNTADDNVGDVMVAPAVDVSNDDDVVVRSVVDDSSDERVAPQAEGDGLSWPEGGFTGETTVTYDANGKGSFADGATTNAVTTKYDGYKETTKYSHTDNVDDAGVQNGGYGNNKSDFRVVTIPGASSLTVDLTYQTAGKESDWVCAYAGGTGSSPAGDAQCSTAGSLTGKLGGKTKTTKSFAVHGDSVTFWFRSDDINSNYYGYYAVVRGMSGSKENVSGAYAVPVDPSDEYGFVGWNTKPDGTGENLGAGEVYLPSSQTVYAQWESNYTKWNTVGWMITDDGVLRIRPWEGDTGTTGSVTNYNGAPWYGQRSNIKKVESTGTIVLNANSAWLFYNCSALTDLSPLASWDVSNVTNMKSMFNGCSSLTNLTAIKDWDTSKVTSLYSTFRDCHSLTSLEPLTNWDTSQVTSLDTTFCNCSSLTDASAIRNWNLNKVRRWVDVSNMFYACNKLQKVGIPSIANGGRKIVAYVSTTRLPDSLGYRVIAEDLQLGPYTWSELNTEMTTNPEGFTEGTVWVKYTPSWFVSYDANGGLGSQDRMTMPVSQSSITLPQSSFVRFGYRFAGWTTQSEPVSDTNPLMQSGDMYAPPSIKEDDRFTLYAQWVPTGAIGDLPTSSQSGLLPGWVQIDQSNAHGVIPAMDTITASFTNKYDPNATSLELQFTKMMDGRIPDKSFDFELMDDAGKVLQTVKSVGSTVSFAPLSFNEVGEHIYYAHETNTTDSTIDYDTDLIQIKVSVTADPDDAAKLKATAQITGDTTFNNTSKPASLTISKKVEGTDDQSRSFTFDVMLADRDNKPVNGSFVTDVSDGTQSSVTFVDGKAQVTIPANATLTIHGLDAYTSYQVSEPVDAMPGGYTLDAITGDTGVLAPAGSSTVTATNTYTAQPAYVTLSATKRLLNEAGDESIMDVGQFSFSLCRVESDDPASPCVGVSDASNDGAGNIAFEQLVFDAPGTYTYRIKEVNGGDAWMQYDKSIIEAVITVRDNGEGALVTDVVYRHADGTSLPDDATMPVFTNVALDRGGFAVTGSGPWMIAGIVAIIMMALALVVALIRRIATV